MIAGLETPTEGSIQIGGVTVFDSEKGINIPANKRKVGFLFQNYALWPNMTVYENISFGLKNIKEELPLYDFVIMNNNRMIEILNRLQEFKDVLKDKPIIILNDKILYKSFNISDFKNPNTTYEQFLTYFGNWILKKNLNSKVNYSVELDNQIVKFYIKIK